MTAINIATDIPSQINTVEKLATWCALVLANINPQMTVIEGVGYQERAAQAGVFYVAADNKYRLLGRVSIEMSPEHLAGGSKSWTYAQELSNTAIPTVFKSN
ncbi:glucose-6-phosphate dehydrogenase [Oculatella sp. LEGE 06141]|uniref:glucose-6-phosphate dehydrogenase n=1 Tax=Oculatella sp. LEGE 06141 TaxID=1828648 RepID=UPI00188198E1|nr:glucose-6-phosphate dehydrogenase [Oculatella sp. LEGE 06141]MBE9182880.1 glucose-6-phosphate dehydrogenase [Oculatella sp. LEGE 06141]